jgi:uncharacterized membrane protein
VEPATIPSPDAPPEAVPTEAAPAETPEPEAAPPEATDPGTSPTLHRGTLSWDGDVPSWVPCGSTEPVALAAVPEGLQAQHAAMTDQPVLVAMMASEREGKLYGLAWHRIFMGGSCDAPLPEGSLWVHGTEPFWALLFDGESAKLTSPEDPEGTSYIVKKGKRGLRLKPRDGVGATLEVTLSDEPCSDGMADAWYHKTVRLEAGKQGRVGCGMYLQ